MWKLPAAMAALVVGLSTASAQSGGSTKPKDRDRPEFDGGRRPKAGDPAADAVVTPEAALEKALPLITTWPAEAGERAIGALIARGSDLIPLLRQRLKGGTVLERSAAARALCLLNDSESFAEVEKLFADPRQRARFAPLLASLHELDAERGGALALRFLESEQAPLRGAATALLRLRATAAVRTALLEKLAATRSDAVRLDLFELLAELKEPTLSAVALERFLGDRNPPLASAVTKLLSWQDDAGQLAELVRLAGGERERRNLHAALALVLHEQRTATPLLPETLFDHYLPMVQTSDALLRATACVVCGMIGYRNEERAAITQEQVVPALADVVIRGRFFGDFELCFKAAVTTLELLTGERLGTSVPAWREWFAANPNARFEGKRELQTLVLDEDGQDAVVTVQRADATGALQPELLLCGERHRGAISAGERPGAIYVPAEEMRTLLAKLQEAGLLAGELPRQLDAPRAGDLVVRLATRGKERVVALSSEAPAAARFERLLRGAAEPGLWQLLLPLDTTFPSRFAEEQAWFSTHADAAARRSRLLDLALLPLSGDDPVAMRNAFRVLERIDALGSAVRATQIDTLAALLMKLPFGDTRTQKLIDLLVSTGRDDAFDRVVDALTPRGGAALESLVNVLIRMDRANRALDDARPLVRLAALSVTERAGVALPEERLVAMARSDQEERVRGKALALLARQGGEAGVALLLEQAQSAPPAVRAEALRLLGLSKRDDALAFLVATAHGEDSALAAAALEGIGRRGDEAGAAALEAVARERGPTEALGRLALAGIKGLPRPLATGRLRRLLAEEQGALAREAAYGLADLGEMDAVPTLLQDLEQEKSHRRAQTLLTYLFCHDPGTETWRFRSLHEAAPSASHLDHFLTALKEGGALVPAGDDRRDPAFQRLLVAAVEDERWFVRRSALELLEATHGRSLGTLASDATRDTIVQLAGRWREVISTQAASHPAETGR